MSDARREMRGARLDDAIDAAVRDMLDVEPRADLRERIVASAFRRNRAAAGSRLPARGFRLPAPGWVPGSIAAAAIVLLAVFVARRSEPVAPRPSVVAHAQDMRLPWVSAPSPAADLPTRAARDAATVAPARPHSLVAAASIPADADPVASVAPLERIAAIAIAPLAQDSITPARLAMAPLSPIEEVQIAPLSPPDRRN